MKVALLQFAPEVGRVQENIQRADDILQDTRIPVDLDWLILPEMAFSGEF
jgi:protein N-terminal amidase